MGADTKAYWEFTYNLILLRMVVVGIFEKESRYNQYGGFNKNDYRKSKKSWCWCKIDLNLILIKHIKLQL